MTWLGRSATGGMASSRPQYCQSIQFLTNLRELSVETIRIAAGPGWDSLQHLSSLKLLIKDFPMSPETFTSRSATAPPAIFWSFCTGQDMLYNQNEEVRISQRPTTTGFCFLARTGAKAEELCTFFSKLCALKKHITGVLWHAGAVNIHCCSAMN